MVILYNLLISVYAFAIKIAALWNSKAKEWIEGRKNVFNYLALKLAAGDEIVWIHCASAGEFEQAKPIIESIKKKYPGYKILISFFSPSGYLNAGKYSHADIITYLPADAQKNAERFIGIVKPRLVIFVKYDLWYHYLSTVSTHKIPLLLVSAVFRKNQVFFKAYGSFYRKMLFYFNHIFVQDQGSFSLLHKIEYNNASVSGDTRFDRVKEIAVNVKEIDLIRSFIKNDQVMVAGSTWIDDEKILAELANHSQIKLIIAPHEINGQHLKQIESLFKYTVRYSALTSQASNAKVLIIDNVGMLSSLYQYAIIAYVGGGFTRDGIHNILEPSVYGKPVIFGPNYRKYREAAELIAAGGGFSISDSVSLIGLVNSLANNHLLLKKAGEAAKKYTDDNTGATKKVTDYIQAKRLLTN